MQHLREEHVKLVAEYQELAATFKDDYPKLKQLKSKQADLEKKISVEEGRILESIKNDYLTALERETALKKDSREKQALALDLNDKATQYKVLEREVETNKNIHSSLLARAKEIDANVGTELGKIQVVDYGMLPLGPYKPDIPLNLALGLIVGLIAGAGVAFLLEFMDNSIKRVDELTDRFQIPVLGVLPLVEEQDLKGLDFIVMEKPKASFSESIRTAKVSIQLSSVMDSTPRSIMITSLSSGEGKSTICYNLAHAFAGSGEKVVILDCDMRKPRLHKAFKNNIAVPSGRRPKGLSEYLSGNCTLQDILLDSKVENLSVVVAGPVPPNPAELLTSNRMRELLSLLGEQYDRVLVDAPPAAGFADVLVLANRLNGVVFVSTLGQTHREALRIFRRSLYSVQGHLLGTIVNKIDLGVRYGGYYYKYYKYYNQYYQPAYATQDSGENLPDTVQES